MLSDVPLAPRTTLGVGGRARRLTRAALDGLPALVLDAARRGEPLLVLGGGSNLLIADAGHCGLAIELTARGRTTQDEGEHVLVRAEAGHDWDDLVAWACREDLAGIECLSGIPGRVGAAPMQNIGAYGQEVGESLVSVEALHTETGERRLFSVADCELGYRTSRFKHREAGRWLVTAVTLRLLRHGAPALRYAELTRRAHDELGGSPSLGQVRALVLAIRRAKSMVLDPEDADARSAGSFFTNPVVDEAAVDAVRAAARARGIDGPVPAWPTAKGIKLAAGWLIDRAGYPPGWGDGPAGLSSKHALAIVNRGGATARDVVGVATRVRRGVRDAFGVHLIPEPVFVGFEAGPDPSAVLDAAEQDL
ncbi:MAG: UDP-N-acetylmuramate dehydrogenase [Deltaproteobacteria bacterium]|nr:UDP-N-acetylmuramate dehydrogenase [Deltaproteobacteria bacterium]